MSIVIKEIQVKMTIDRNHSPTGIPEDMVRRLKTDILRELRENTKPLYSRKER